MFSRLKQFLRYLFVKYDKKNDIKIKKVLNQQEFEIFSQMSNYDKVHSYGIFKKVEKSNIFSSRELYLKLSLLHDCGKDNASLFKRIKKVIFNDKILEKHPFFSYEKLKNVNIEVAELCLIHHNKNVEDIQMKYFQKFDDEE